MKQQNVSIKYFPILILLLFLGSCNSNKTVPFPENPSGYKVPETKSFKYPEASPIDWQEVSKDSVPIAKVYPFDIDKLPSKSLVVNTFKPEKEPLTSIPLNWDQLEQKPFSIDTAKTDTFQVRSFLLPKPEITKSSPPSQYPRSTSGILQMGVEEGLPSNYVYATAIDNNGFIWISTERGLVCYKGEFFETYDFVPGLPNGNADFFWYMRVDKDNNLWMISTIGKMYRLNTTSGLVQLLELEDPFASVISDAKGKLWYTAFDQGTGVIDFEKKTIKRFLFLESQESIKRYIGLIKDSKNNIWIGDDDKIFILNPDQTAYRVLDKKNGFESTINFDFFETKSGDIWINSFSEGAYSIAADKKSIRILNHKQDFNGSVMGITEDNAGKIWIADDDTIYIHDPVNHFYKKIPTGVTMFRNNVPGTTLLDHEGNIWIGTPQNKMLIIDPYGGLPEHLDMNDGLISNDVWGILEDDDGLIWMGTYNGIQIYDPTKNKIVEITTKNGLTQNRRIQICTLEDGRIFVGGSRGFTIFDKERKSFTEYSTPVFIGACLAQKHENIWIGSTDGIYNLNLKNQTLKKVTHCLNTPLERIWNFKEDNEGRIWVITITGTFLIDPKQDNIAAFGDKEGMQVENISVIHKTNTGEIWIGGNPGFSVINTGEQTITNISAEQGLYPETMYEMAELNGRMYLGSQDGIVLVETPKQSTDSQKWHFYNYGKGDGFPFNDYNQKASFTLKNGQVWWGVTPQITVLTQEPEIIHNTPRVFVSGITIMDQTPDFYDKEVQTKIFREIDTLWNYRLTDYELAGTVRQDSGYYTAHHIEWDSISSPFNLPIGLKLPYDQNSLSFSFSNPDVIGRDEIVYRYILEGEDESWSRISNESTSRTYYNLKHGQYIFKVATRGFNGEWSEPAQFEFTIMPPWWLTPPAYLLYLVIFIGIAIAIDRLQRRRIVNRERERAREKELAQAKEIEKAYNELKTTQKQLIQSEKMASLGELTAGIAHEIQNPLNFVNNFSEVNKELIAEMKEEIANNKLDEATALANDIDDNEEKIIYHGKRADAIVKSMLLHSRGSSGQKELTDMNTLADEYLRLSYHGLRAKDKAFNADFKLEADPELPKIKVIPQDIGRVLINLINNAFYAVYDKSKQKPKGYKPLVSVSTKTLANKIEISVKDNGSGIPDKLREKIFQPFFTTKPTGQGTGLGLSLSYDIIKAHNGSLKVNSEENMGTEFIITLPV